MARPSKFNQKLANRILELYSSGKSMVYIEKLKGLPSRRTVIRWRKQFPVFAVEYESAIDCYTDTKIETLINKIETCEDSRQAKLLDIEFKSLSWFISKINRLKYGEKLDVQHSITVDIAPALLEANTRIKAITSGQRVLDVPCEKIADID